MAYRIFLGCGRAFAALSLIPTVPGFLFRQGKDNASGVLRPRIWGNLRSVFTLKKPHFGLFDVVSEYFRSWSYGTEGIRLSSSALAASFPFIRTGRIKLALLGKSWRRFWLIIKTKIFTFTMEARIFASSLEPSLRRVFRLSPRSGGFNLT